MSTLHIFRLCHPGLCEIYVIPNAMVVNQKIKFICFLISEPEILRKKSCYGLSSEHAPQLLVSKNLTVDFVCLPIAQHYSQ